MSYTKKDLGKGQIEFTGTIPYEEFVIHETAALERIAKTLEVDGFRKGSVPPSVARQHIQDLALLEAMAEEALMKAYGDIITNHAQDAIGRPDIQITKIARDNPLEFKVTVTVMPEIKLPDYKKIAKTENKEKKEVVVTDEDVEKSVKELQKLRAGGKKLHTHDDGSVHDDQHNAVSEEEAKANEELPLPELNDEFAQSFGEQFKTMEDLKTKVRENMLMEKKIIEEDKIRAKIAEKIVEGVVIDLPDMLINGEIERMAYQMESDLANSGLNLEDYAKNIGKSLDEIKAEWRPSAEKRVKLQLSIDEIAKVEDIKPEPEKVELEVKQLKAYYKDVDELRAKIYVESQLKNEKVFAFLSEQ